jgi:YD repeat-containing protein
MLRLTGDVTVGTNAHVYTYAYDGCGNRLTSTETGNLATTTYNAAQQIGTTLENTVGTTTYSYDLNGNTTSVVLPPGKPPVTMSYDKENRLAVHQSGSSVATYAYDGCRLRPVSARSSAPKSAASRIRGRRANHSCLGRNGLPAREVLKWL